MVTAADANILIDVLAGDVAESEAALEALTRAESEGIVVISIVAYAELAAGFKDARKLTAFLKKLTVQVAPIDQEIALLASRFHRDYRMRGGTRTRILADFLIAAHAQLRADRLLTRDQRFFTEHFSSLNAIAPEEL